MNVGIAGHDSPGPIINLPQTPIPHKRRRGSMLRKKIPAKIPGECILQNLDQDLIRRKFRIVHS